MEREQEKREKIEKMTRTGKISSQAAEAATSKATTTSMAKEAENAFSVSNNRTHSDKGSRKDKCGNDVFSTEGRGCSKKLLCYKHRQKKKLLYI